MSFSCPAANFMHGRVCVVCGMHSHSKLYLFFKLGVGESQSIGSPQHWLGETPHLQLEKNKLSKDCGGAAFDCSCFVQEFTISAITGNCNVL